MRARTILCFIPAAAAAVVSPGLAEPSDPAAPRPAAEVSEQHLEIPADPYQPVPREGRATRPARRWLRDGHLSIQVNVDAGNNNILNDAANEPSIAVDPTNPNRIAIGWRQFDTINSNFRQAGYGFSADGGKSWTFPGVFEPGIFRSDPVLDFDAEGNFFYNSLRVPGGNFVCDSFKSTDGGATWDDGVFAFGGDKVWMGIDRTGGIGHGHIYTAWSVFAGCCGGNTFNRSVDGGEVFEPPAAIPQEPIFGVTAVGPGGEVYVAGRGPASPAQFFLARSSTAQDPEAALAFDFSVPVDLAGSMVFGAGPNPGGLLGQVWVAADHSDGPTRGNVYILSSVDPPGADPLDVHFVRSTDGGATWSRPLRVNDDLEGTNAWQWFGTMSVAPDGRIDAVWNDTRNDPGGFDSELFYARSVDGGRSWSKNEPLSPPFDPHLGWPQQNKLGDYYDMVSDRDGAHLAYAATFNGEQDVYYQRVLLPLFRDGFESGDTSAWSQTVP